MTSGTATPDHRVASARGGFRWRWLWIFGAQFVVVAVACLLGIHRAISPALALVSIAVVCAFAWLAAWWQWRAVGMLARRIEGWEEGRSDPDTLRPEHLPPGTNADVAALALGFHDFAGRIAGYNERERHFTRDASHELRSPLTVIKMSVDLLVDEVGLGLFGQRSVQRIQRAAREMETLVEALLILARDGDEERCKQAFVVNEVLRDELADAREMLHGQPVELQLDESVCFALQGSPRVFAVLCWQLIRHACEYTGQGTVQVTVSPGMVSVRATAGAERDPHAPEQPGFEYAIAQRIGERFGWPLELRVQGGDTFVAEIRFPQHSILSL